MKRNFLIGFALTFICFQINAQSVYKLSIDFGMHYSQWNSVLFGQEYNSFYKPYYKSISLGKYGLGLEVVNDAWIYKSGIYFGYRGYKELSSDNFIKYERRFIQSYMELPVICNYSFYKDKLNAGLGLIFHRRMEDAHYVPEQKYNYGIELRICSSWNITQKVAATIYYTIGNIDKYIFHIQNNHLHQLYGIEIKYNFLILQPKGSKYKH